MTHPFHPLTGREFPLVEVRQLWGEVRVYFRDERGELASLPAAWTDAVDPDPFVEISAGRTAFRLADLLELVRLAGGVVP